MRSSTQRGGKAKNRGQARRAVDVVRQTRKLRSAVDLLSTAAVVVAGKVYKLEDETTPDGVCHRLKIVIAEGEQCYVYASISPVHKHGCAACRMGKKHGPCDCGAQRLFDDIIGPVQLCDAGTHDPTWYKGPHCPTCSAVDEAQEYENCSAYFEDALAERERKDQDE